VTDKQDSGRCTRVAPHEPFLVSDAGAFEPLVGWLSARPERLIMGDDVVFLKAIVIFTYLIVVFNSKSITFANEIRI